jgi:hypothetical protein
VEVLCEEIPFLGFQTAHFTDALETYLFEIPTEHISDDSGASWDPLCGTAEIKVDPSQIPSFCELTDSTILSCLATDMLDIGVHTFTVSQDTYETVVTLTVYQGNLTELTEFTIPENSVPEWRLDEPLV